MGRTASRPTRRATCMSRSSTATGSRSSRRRARSCSLGAEVWVAQVMSARLRRAVRRAPQGLPVASSFRQKTSRLTGPATSTSQMRTTSGSRSSHHPDPSCSLGARTSAAPAPRCAPRLRPAEQAPGERPATGSPTPPGWGPTGRAMSMSRIRTCSESRSSTHQGPFSARGARTSAARISGPARPRPHARAAAAERKASSSTRTAPGPSQPTGPGTSTSPMRRSAAASWSSTHLAASFRRGENTSTSQGPRSARWPRTARPAPQVFWEASSTRQ